MALRAQAARSPVPVVLEADQVGRYPQDAESTVYFCTLEALQNVAKHARASRATVRLSGSGGALEFSVSDDGAGFPAAATSHGSGLQGMSDRLAAHGGTLAVPPSPARAPPSPAGCLHRSGRPQPGSPRPARAELIMRVRTKGERSCQCRPERSGNPHARPPGREGVITAAIAREVSACLVVLTLLARTARLIAGCLAWLSIPSGSWPWAGPRCHRGPSSRSQKPPAYRREA